MQSCDQKDDYYDIDRMINEGLAGGYMDERYGSAQFDLPEKPKEG